MPLTNSDIADLRSFRRQLHRFPELSGQEEETAKRLRDALAAASPDSLLTGLGGHGLAAVYQGARDGPSILFRCELDALPIRETGNLPYRSEIDGRGHLCGHDGHMAILAGLARCLSRQRPKSGRAVLLFQPAEETGAGAEAVLTDSKFVSITPEYSFSLHNMPGLPMGHVGLRDGPVNCASRGLHLTLAGKAAHASDPVSGISPMQALSRLMPELTGLSHGTPDSPDFTLVTVTHARLGEPAFGIAPGEATLFVTLRTLTDDRMTALVDQSTSIIEQTARAEGLQADYRFEDIFKHCENDPEATDILRRALDGLGLPHDETGQPWRASEDFGRFAAVSKSAMFLLGSGTDHAALHNPDFDFPDDLIPVGVRIFERVLRDLLG